MPAGYDGSEFVGIDEECIEPNGAAARFWSAYFDNALANNIQYIAELGHEVAWAPLTSNGGNYNNKEGVRPYTSLNRTSVFVVPWIFAEDVTQLQLGLIARVADEPGDGQGVGVALQRRTADLATIVRSSTTASLGSTVGGTTVKLQYRVDNSSPVPFSTMLMTDDGTGADASAGDGV